jgi:hypothetical protein
MARTDESHPPSVAPCSRTFTTRRTSGAGSRLPTACGHAQRLRRPGTSLILIVPSRERAVGTQQVSGGLLSGCPIEPRVPHPGPSAATGGRLDQDGSARSAGRWGFLGGADGRHRSCEQITDQESAGTKLHWSGRMRRGQGRARVNVVALDDPCGVFGLYNGRSPALERLLAIEARRTHLQGSPNFEGCNGGSNRGRRGRASPWWCVTPPMSV